MGIRQVRVKAQGAGAGSLLLQFYYQSAWRPAVLHYQAQLWLSNENEQHQSQIQSRLQKLPWEFKEMEWCGERHPQWEDWEACELLLPENIARLEFVCCNREHTLWDNPGASFSASSPTNYVIDFLDAPAIATCDDSVGSNSRSSDTRQSTHYIDGPSFCHGGDANDTAARLPDLMPLRARVAETKLVEATIASSFRSIGCSTGSSSNSSSRERKEMFGCGTADTNSKVREHIRRVVCTLVQGNLAVVQGRRCLLVTDLDGTLLGNDAYLSQFNKHWKLQHMWRGSLLVYNTGRNLKDFLCVAGSCRLLRPEYAILGVGTEVYSFSEKPVRAGSMRVEEWLLTEEERKQFRADIELTSVDWPRWCPTREHAILDGEWLTLLHAVDFDRRSVEREAAANLPGCFVNGNIFHDPFRLSISVPLPILKEALAGDAKVAVVQQQQKHPPGREFITGKLSSVADDGRNRPTAAVTYLRELLQSDNRKICISGGGDWRYVDVLPVDGGKLSATLFVMKQLRFEISETVVAGDSGNDIDLFCCVDIAGICVGNAQAELRDFLKSGLSFARGLRTSSEGRESMRKRNAGRTVTSRICFAERDCAGGLLEGLIFFQFDRASSMQN